MNTFNQTARQNEMKNKIFNALGLAFIYMAAATLIFLKLRSSM